METQRVQETLHHVHNHEHTKSGTNEHPEADKHEQDVVGFEARYHGAIVEYLSQLRVSQRQRPQTKVGSRVGDGSQDELDNFDDLVNHDLQEVFISVHLVWVDKGVHYSLMEVKCIVSGGQDFSSLRSLNKVVVMGCIVATDWCLSVTLFLKLILMFHFLVHRAVDVAGFDTEHQGDADKDNKHERVHKGDLVVIRASVAEEGSLVRVRWLATIHGHIEHRVDDSWGF